MAAQAATPSQEPPPAENNRISMLWRKFLGKNSNPSAAAWTPQGGSQEPDPEESPSSGIIRRVSRKVVPGLPRAKTFKRQQSENREKLEPIQPTQAERRAVSVDRRGHPLRRVSNQNNALPRASAPDFIDDTYSTTYSTTTNGQTLSVSQSPVEEKQYHFSVSDTPTIAVDQGPDEEAQIPRALPGPPSTADAQSVTTSQYDVMIHDELERKWILNLSMHFRDKSKREKFFVTYREKESKWRRVTISLDYRNAPDDSLEKDLIGIKFQREKSSKIYEAIRESLQDIQFYETVTNLKLQTTDGRLHVHVVEDVNEIIHYPTVGMVQHLGCARIREKDLEFDSHMSGFVYKVRVDGQTLIKKEIPGPDTVDEFLYEVNALNSLHFSRNVIEFYGVVVDDENNVKGLLIDYAEQGALIDVIYDSQERHGGELTWLTREKWARQIVQGLSDIHEAGFVQGDFTLSNIVIDNDGNAKIIDINRRGCPVGWEPPEATPLIDSNQRISMYIGVKSDLYQLGMVLWALATLEDEPEAHPRPLRLDPEIDVPPWYRRIVENCLSDNPRARLQATQLLTLFPEAYDEYDPPSISVDDGYGIQEYLVEGVGQSGRPHIRTVTPRNDWGYASPGLSEDSYYYPPRGRSPPSPLPSHFDCESPAIAQNVVWSNHHGGAPSVSDVNPDEAREATPKNGQSPSVRDSTEMSSEVLRDAETTSLSVRALGSGSTGGKPSIEPDLASQAPQIVVEDVDTSIQFSADLHDSLLDDDPTPTGKASEPHGLETAQAEPDHHPAPSRDQTCDVQKAVPEGHSEPIQEGTPRSLTPQREHEIGAADTRVEIAHDSREVSLTRPTAATTASAPLDPEMRQEVDPSRKVLSELTGIGSAHEGEDAIRQPICSDEDLGIITSSSSSSTTTTTTTAPAAATVASQNVASQA